MANKEVKLIVTGDASGGVTAMRQASAEIKSMAASAQGMTSNLSSGLLALVARFGPIIGLITGIGAAIKQTAADGDKFLTMSERLGTSVENLSKLDQAARVSGSSIEGLEGMMGKLVKNMEEASHGGNQTSMVFKTLGVRVTDTQGNLRDASEVMVDIAKRFGEMEDSSGRAAISMMLFGKSGREAVPALNEMARSFDTLKPLMTTEMAKAGDEFNDNIERMEDHIKRLTYAISPLLTVLNNLFDSFTQEGQQRTQIKWLEAAIKNANWEIEALEGKGKGAGGFLINLLGTEADLNAAKTRLKNYTDELQAYLTHYETKREGPKLPPPIIPDEAKLKAAAAATAEWQEKIALLNPELTDLDKEIIKIEADYKKATQEGLVSVKLLDEWKSAAKGAAIEKDLQKQIIERAKLMKEDAKNWSEAMDAEMRISQEGWNELAKLDEKGFKERVERQQKEVEEWERLVTAGNEYQNLLIDVAEAERRIGANEALRERIALYQRIIVAETAELATRDKESAAYFEQLNKIKGLELAVAGFSTKLRELSGTFGEGWTEGMKEYFDELNNGFSRGKDMAADFARAGEDLLTNMWDGPGKAAKSFFENILNMLKRTIAQALMSPIMVQIQGVVGGAFGGGAGLPTGQAGPGIIPSNFMNSPIFPGLQGPTQTGAPLGSWYNNITPTNAIGAIGGLYGMYQGYNSGNPLMGGMSGMMAGASIGSIIPGVGTIIGAAVGTLVGAIAGLLGGKIKDSAQLAFEYSPSGNFADIKYGGNAISGAYAVGAGGKNSNFGNMANEMLPIWEKFREETKKTFDELGYDISGFNQEFHKTLDTLGKSKEEVDQMIQDTFGEAMKQWTGINFKDWQKSGEEITATIDRILTALQAIPKLTENINDMIFAIQNSLDPTSLLTQKIGDMKSGIEDLRKAYNDLTDPADQVAQLQKISQATVQMYDEIYNTVMGIVNSIKQTGAERIGFNITMSQKIGGLQGVQQTVDALSSAMAESLKAMDSATSAAEKLQYLGSYIGYLDQWVEQSTSLISEQYAGMKKPLEDQIALLEKEKDAIIKDAEARKQAFEDQKKAVEDQIKLYQDQKTAIEENIQYLNDQVDALGDWKSVLKSVTSQILDIQTSGANPNANVEAIAFARNAMESLKALYESSTGVDKAKFGSEYQDALGKYLSLAQQYQGQMGAGEYNDIYNTVMTGLTEIQKDATAFAGTQEDYLAQIVDLQTASKGMDEQIAALQQSSNAIDQQIAAIMTDTNAIDQQIADKQAEIAAIDTQMNEAIQAFKDSAVQYYQWAQTEGDKLYAQKIDELNAQLRAVIGSGTVEDFIAQLKADTISELQKIEDLLNGILNSFTSGAPTSPGAGAVVTPPPAASEQPPPPSGGGPWQWPWPEGSNPGDWYMTLWGAGAIVPPHGDPNWPGWAQGRYFDKATLVPPRWIGEAGPEFGALPDAKLRQAIREEVKGGGVTVTVQIDKIVLENGDPETVDKAMAQALRYGTRTRAEVQRIANGQ